MGNLTKCQEVALDKINAWLKSDQQFFVLGGYAGTGKTFLANKITNSLGGEEKVLHCAYTGKAALALRERGVDGATTIHRLLYSHYDVNKAIEALPAVEQHVKPGNLWEKQARQLQEIISNRKDAFTINPKSAMRDADLVMVDEFSMLNKEVIDDLLSIAKKVLFLGDPAQLAPVEGVSPLRPDFFLDEVVRQALDNPVLRAATLVREGKKLDQFCDWGEFKWIRKAEASWDIVSGVDQVLCGTNKTRQDLNRKFRQQLGFSGINPVQGDKLVCLQNDHMKELYNGTVGTCHDIKKNVYKQTILNFNQKGKLFPDLLMWDFYKKQPPLPRERKEYQFFDFGYALTVHKAQGSEWDNIMIFNECHNMQGFLYTALTRARKTAILVGA